MEKYLYKIGEVSEMIGVEPHVIRYWEKEMPFIAPRMRGNGGQRLYTIEDIKKLTRIKKLLYEDGMKIEGVKKIFLVKSQEDKRLLKIKEQLLEVKELLEKM